MAEDVHCTCNSRKSHMCEHSMRSHEQWRTAYAGHVQPNLNPFFDAYSFYLPQPIHVPLHDSFSSWHCFIPVFTAYIYSISL